MDAIRIEFFEKESGEVRTNHEYFVLNGEVWRDNYDTCESQQAVVGFDRFVVKVPEIGWRVPALASKEAEIERLRSALSAMLTHMGMDEDEWNKPTFDQARAALRSVS